MSAESLRADAKRHTAEGLEFMPVVVPKGFKRPPRWPRGELLSMNPAEERIYRMSIKKLLAWLDWAEGEAPTPPPHEED